MIMMNWFRRIFTVISNEKALSMGLTHVRNIHGDEINYMGCRSIWEDNKGRTYRVKSIHLTQ